MFSFHSIQQYQNSLLNGTTTCVEAVEFFLARIEALRRLNAFTEVYTAEARLKASELDRQRAGGKPVGKLHGVVVAIKDVICYKDHRITAASHILQGFESTYHATAVEKLLAEDAIIIGACNCDEFAMGSSNENSYYGKTHNALNESLVPGGSSGGSAVAVQAGLCMASLGSDTGGSVRQPADFCGIVGLKPSYGRVSRHGLIAYGSSFDQIGIFSKTVTDAALVLEVIAGPDEFDSTVSHEAVPEYSKYLNEPLPALRIGYFEDALNHPALDPEIGRQVKDYFEQLKAKGYKLSPLRMGMMDYIVPAYYVLTTAEASSNLSRYDGVRFGYRTHEAGLDLADFYKKSRSEGFGKEVKRRIMLGTFVLSAGYFDAYFTQAQKVRRLLVDQAKQHFNNFDLIFLPTVPATAFPIGEKNDDPIAMYLADIYTVYANLVGIPAISLPLFTHSNGMPFGLQAMTNQFCELSLLQLSYQLLAQ